MAISKHILLLKAGIAVSCLALSAFIVSATRIIPVYPDLIFRAAQRTASAFILRLLPTPEPYAAFAGAGAAVLFAVAAQIFLLYFFEKTQSAEIRLLGIFLFSFTFEIIRIALPLKTALHLSGYIPVITSRLIIFGRFYGLFAVFAAALCASGFKTRKEENLIFAIAVAALLFAFRMPVDTFNFDTNLYPITGFHQVFKNANAALVMLSVFCFVSGAYTRSCREYYFIAAGLLASVIGRTMLFEADTWLMLFPGLALLVFGAWFTGRAYRRMYLWV
jgi:hypothetical protein